MAQFKGKNKWAILAFSCISIRVTLSVIAILGHFGDQMYLLKLLIWPKMAVTQIGHVHENAKMAQMGFPY